MGRGRPPPFNGALVVPKQRRPESMLLIERSLQPATSAIWVVSSDLLITISRMSSCCEAARFGAMLTFGFQSSSSTSVKGGIYYAVLSE
jgi:hypothetical protein